jgi:hypothetical protein
MRQNKMAWWLTPERGLAAASLLIIAILLRGPLSGQATFAHDNFLWNFPVFHFFVENLSSGHLPLWNPYTHAGEPVYPILAQMRLFEPLSLLTIGIGRWFTKDTTTLFNWDRLIQVLIQAFGVYLLLRPLATRLLTRCCLIVVVCFSSLFLCSFPQDGILSQFCWTPFIAIFLLRIVYAKDLRWFNWLFLGAFLGIRCQSYWFVGTAMFLLFFFSGLLLFRRDLLIELSSRRDVWFKAAVTTAIAVGMFAPNLSLFLERDRFVFPVRTAEGEKNPNFPTTAWFEDQDPKKKADGIFMDYSTLRNTGSRSTPWDFIQMIAPGNPNLAPAYGFHGTWGQASEAANYLGLLVWALGLIGIFYGQHPLRRVGLTLLAGFGLLMLGSMGGLHRLLYYLYPPTRFARHTHTFVMYFGTVYLGFFALGLEYVLQQLDRKKSELPRSISLKWTALYAAITFALIFGMLIMVYPLDKLVFVPLLGIAAVGYLGRKKWGKEGALIGLALAQIGIVLFCHPNRANFLGMLFWVLITPLGLMFTLWKLPLADRHPTLKRALGVLVVGCLMSDLIFHFQQQAQLFSHPTASGMYHIDTALRPPMPLPSRRLYEINVKPGGEQAMRYYSMVAHDPSLLSAISADNDPTNLAEALKQKQWTTSLASVDFYHLLHSSVSPAALTKIFAIDESTFQFKRRAIATPDHQTIAALENYPAEQLVSFLNEGTFVEGSGATQVAANLSARETASSTVPAEFAYKISKFSYNALDIHTRTKIDGLFYWADGFDKWWTATLDGNPIEILRANGNFKAIPISAGEHVITFRYRPEPFLWAMMAFYTLFAVGIIGGTFTWMRRKPLARRSTQSAAKVLAA